MCIYTAVKTKQGWIDSSQAIWDVKVANNILNAIQSLDHLGIDCIQRQNMRFADKHEIVWQSDFKLKKSDIEQIAAGVMVNKQFCSWQVYDGAEQKNGKFRMSEGRENQWQQVASAKDMLVLCDKTAGNIEITFDCDCNIDYENVIEDTDHEHNGRLLVCKTKYINPKDKDISFRAVIKINTQNI